MMAIVSLSSLNSLADNTNKIEIEQVSSGGENLILSIDQIGYDNKIFFSIGDSDSTNINLKQVGHNNEIGWSNDWPNWGSAAAYGGDIDSDNSDVKFWQNCTKSAGNCNKNDIQFHVALGDNNKVWWGQGFIIDSRTDTSWSLDSSEGGGHTATLDVHGDRNTLVGHQRNCSAGVCSGHTSNIWIYGDDNSVFAKQEADGSKNLTLVIYNDDNTVDIEQNGYATHTASIYLTGTYGTVLDLSQTASTAQTYSLSQNCQTVGGCNISVSQGD